MTDTMEEGVLIQWNVDEGAQVAAGDIIAQVETDKATMDVEAYDDGVLLRRVAAEGEALSIGALIAVLGQIGEDVDAFLAGRGKESASASAPSQAVASDSASSPTASATPAASDTLSTGRLRASPLARRMAKDHGLELGTLTGSGPKGRIIKRDIETQLARPAPAVVPMPEPSQKLVRRYTSVPLTPMRKTIARRLAASKYTAPHFYLTVDVAMERAIEARRRMNADAHEHGGTKVSFNDLVTKACGVALEQHPAVNSSFDLEDNEIRQHGYVDIGFAVAIDDGLVTPVVRDVPGKGLGAIATESAGLAQRARARQLQPPEMEGSTFTTSNLGMLGIQEFTAIINPPNACILAIGAIRDVPVVQDGQVVPGKRMKLTLSCDHRVVDGATGARYLASLRRLLEEPLLLLM